MGRPSGAKNKPGSKKPGRKPGQTKFFSRISDAQRLAHKADILEELLSGRATTLSQAATNVGVNPVAAYAWAEHDKDFQLAVRNVKEVLADELEDKLLASPNIIAQIFMLKGLRHEYRDNYKVEHTSPALEEWFKAQKAAQDTKDEPKQIEAPSAELLVPTPVESAQFVEVTDKPQEGK